MGSIRPFDWFPDAPAKHGPYAAALRAHQVYHVVRHIPMTASANFIVSTLLVVVIARHISLPLVVLWYALAIGGALQQFIAWLRLRSRPLPRGVSTRTHFHLILFCGLYGLLWGFAGFFFLVPETVVAQVTLIFIIGGMIAGMFSILYVVPTACFAYALAAATPLTARLIIQGDQLSLTLALLIQMFTLTILVATTYSFQQFADVIRMKTDLENARADLLDGIGSISQAFVLFNNRGQPVVANDKYVDFFGPPQSIREIPHSRSETHQLADGRWIMSSYRRTSGGGTVSTHADISDVIRREQELQDARDQAEGANRTKSEFLALMSHELRTPLNAIVGFADAIRSGVVRDNAPERIREYGGYILDSGLHLLELINGILDLSKIEAGKYELDEEIVDVAEIAIAAINMVAAQATLQGIEIRNRIGAGTPRLFADERALRQILINLVGNAIKFTDGAGRVELSARYGASGMSLIVSDEGIGIAPEALKHVLEPFYQAESHLRREREGTGLGLPMVHRLMSLHDGTIEIESKPGRGTTVTVHFGAERLRSHAGRLATA